jgi:ADP-heptose:LPS heptosyltransferase
MTRPHVLVARMDNDGDVLLAGPAIRAVAAGAARVTLLCGPGGEQAARLLPGVDEVLVHHCPWIDARPRAVGRAATEALVGDVAARAPDQAFVLTSFHQSPLPLALLLRLAGVGMIAATSVDYPGSLLDVRHRIDEEMHEVERSLSLVGTLGYVPPPGDDRRLAVRRAAPPGAGRPDPPYVVVHPGASVPARAWAPDRCAELAGALAATGRRVVVTGAPAEWALTAGVAGGRPGVTNLGGATTLAQLADVLADADCVVVGNTGPAHLAAAVGTPVVSLFAPTVPAARWRPWGVPHLLLFVPVACAGCRARVCPEPGHPCLDGVRTADVLAAVARLAPPDAAVAA